MTQPETEDSQQATKRLSRRRKGNAARIYSLIQERLSSSLKYIEI